MLPPIDLPYSGKLKNRWILKIGAVHHHGLAAPSMDDA